MCVRVTVISNLAEAHHSTPQHFKTQLLGFREERADALAQKSIGPSTLAPLAVFLLY